MTTASTPVKPAPNGKTAMVIGAGPAGLMAAERLAGDGYAVTIYEGMPSAGRKFLMAGKSGLNITHGEDLETFLTRYGASRERLEPHLPSARYAAKSCGNAFRLTRCFSR